MASTNDTIIEEIEALEAIMEDEVSVNYDKSGNPVGVEVTVKPATAQIIDQQHVRVTLVVNLPLGYPDEPPDLIFRNPRGIDDSVLEAIRRKSIQKSEEFLGCPIIYELIELVREQLTDNNTPSCPCAICLFHFTSSDCFSKTQCFHYFHSNCLGRYIINCEATALASAQENKNEPYWLNKDRKQHILCPICREELEPETSGSCLLLNPPPEEGLSLKDFSPNDPDIKLLQEKMHSLYIRQKENGGIIDLEEEKNKFLVSAGSEEMDDENPNEENISEDNTNSQEVPPTKNITNNSGANQAKLSSQSKNKKSGNYNYVASRGGKNRNRRGNQNSYHGGRNHGYSSSDVRCTLPSINPGGVLVENDGAARGNTSRDTVFASHKLTQNPNHSMTYNYQNKQSNESIGNAEVQNSSNQESSRVDLSHDRRHYRGKGYQKYSRGGRNRQRDGPPPGFACATSSQAQS